MSAIIEKACQWAECVAGCPEHGYSQRDRWGPDYDCSSFVISAFKQAGVPLECTYTGNMKSDMLEKGFVMLPKNTELTRGDVLLNEKNHCAIYIGDGKIVHASIAENGTIYPDKVGDQTGGEILIREYYDYPWDCVMRFGGENVPLSKISGFPITREGDSGAHVAAIQAALNYHGFSVAVNGVYNAETESAVLSFQSARGIEVDGIVGNESASYIFLT